MMEREGQHSEPEGGASSTRRTYSSLRVGCALLPKKVRTLGPRVLCAPRRLLPGQGAAPGRP